MKIENSMAEGELRRVQFTGKSSYTLTLPKDWVERVDLKKGDFVRIIPQPDGSLLLTAKKTSETAPRIAHIAVMPDQDPDSLLRIFIAKYLAGYQLFRFTSNDVIPPNLRKTITACTSGLLGLEVVEETANRIEVQNLLSPEELTVERAARRAHLVASSMFETAMNALEVGNKKMAEGVLEREPGVDRLYFLVLRQLTLALQNPALMKELEIEPVGVLDYQMLMKSVERIADHATRISEIMLAMEPSEVEPEILKSLVELGRKAVKVSGDAMHAFFLKDAKLANEAIRLKDDVVKELSLLNRRLLERPGRVAVNLRIITDSIERAADYGANIAEIAIDRDR
ncbi:MAG: PhoU domain-containing protein [Candidatus Bathyarchaeia archaeon]